MSTIINDKRKRDIDPEKMERYTVLNEAPLVKGFILGDGPCLNQSQNYGTDPLGKPIKKPITDFLMVRPMPRNGLHYYFLFHHCGDFPIYNDAFVYRYRFDHVNEEEFAVYLMPRSNA